MAEGRENTDSEGAVEEGERIKDTDEIQGEEAADEDEYQKVVLPG